MTDNPSVIEVNKVVKVYEGLKRKTLALNNVTFSVSRGTIFALIGQNGAGKTTLVKLLLGLSYPTSGSVSVLGSSPRRSEIRGRIGYLPEQTRLPDYLHADGLLRYIGRLNHVSADALNKRIPQLLDLVGLSDSRLPIKKYSKGMQQRLGIAQALINDPALIFLDEPTDGLDPVARKDVRDLLSKLREQGKTIFLNSHLLAEIEQVCDTIAILKRGEMVRTISGVDFCKNGEGYLVRLSHTLPESKRFLTPTLSWEENLIRFQPRSISELNAVIDRLRANDILIESVEPTKTTLEQIFLETIQN